MLTRHLNLLSFRAFGKKIQIGKSQYLYKVYLSFSSTPFE